MTGVYWDQNGQPVYVVPPTMIGGVQPYGLNPNITDTTDLNGTNTVATELLELAALHNQLLVSGQLISTGTGDDTVSPLPTSTIRKPWLDAPDGTFTFDEATSVALPVVGSVSTVVTHTVPTGYDGVVNAISWNFTGGGFVQGSGDLKAQLLRNGAAIRGYDNIVVEKGTIGIARPISPLRTYSGDIISLVINHVANNILNGNVVGSLVGWDYPSAS